MDEFKKQMPLTDVFSKNNGKKNYFNRFDIESTPK